VPSPLGVIIVCAAAGHGGQVTGDNYLLPIDMEVEEAGKRSPVVEAVLGHMPCPSCLVDTIWY
jgi:hypothetical protein